jgi:APA family basic amino acid/polyamine antiporter
VAVENAEQHLKKQVSFLGLLAMCVGLNIGGALFALTTVAAGFSGPSLPLAMLVSAVPVLLAVVPYVTLTSVMPTTSATYRYSQLISPFVAIVSVLTLLVCMLIGGQPLYAIAFGKYLEALLPLDPIWTGVGVLTAFYVINLMGVRRMARIQTVLFFILLSALILYIVLGLPSVRAENFSPLFPNGVGGVLAASGLLFTFSAGGIFVIDLGGEVMRAKKTFSRALPAGIGIAVLLYALIGAATVGVVDVATLPDKTSLIEVAKRFMPGSALAYFIVGGALVACATTINIVFTIISRGLLVVAEEGLLPRSFGRVNARFGTPHWGLTAAYLVCVAALLIIPSLAFLPPLIFFGSMLNLGLILSMSVVTLSGFVFPMRYPALFEGASMPFSARNLRIICGTVLVLNTLIFAFFTVAIGKASLVFLCIVLACCIYAGSQRRRLTELKESRSPGGAGRPACIFWMEEEHRD